MRSLGMYKVESIKATTPIVKFSGGPRSRMQCDINVNDLGGWLVHSLWFRIYPY